MGRRPQWATGPTKKEIRAALEFYSGNISQNESRRARAEKFNKTLTKIRTPLKSKP